MNQELFDSMQEQMKPSPEIRAALSEKLAQPVKRRMPVRKYVAIAACAALVIGSFSLYNLYQNPVKWMRITQNFRHDVTAQHLHSYVTVEGLTGYITLNSGDVYTESGAGDLSHSDLPDRDSGAPTPNTGDLSNAEIVDIEMVFSAQEGAINSYEKLMDHFSLGYPDWYGGAYIDNDNNLMVLLVSDKNPGDKSLEQKVLRWTNNGPVVFGSAKYSLRYLLNLQDKVVDAMQELGLFSSCGTAEKQNRLDLTLTSVTDEALAILAWLDPEDDAIYVQTGQRISFDVDHDTEDLAVIPIQPGGAIPEGDDPIIIEPYYDGAEYDLEHLPEELPEKKQPAIKIQSASEDASTASRDLNP